MTATMPTIGRQELYDAIQARAIVPLDAQGAGSSDNYPATRIRSTIRASL